MTERLERRRRIGAAITILGGISLAVLIGYDSWQPVAPHDTSAAQHGSGPVADLLSTIPVKGRAPKTGYTRAQFGDGWANMNGCDTRDIILHRDMTQVVVDSGCHILSGVLNDPYTGKVITFKRGAGSSSDVQIDHVVALSDSWQKGAQLLTKPEREKLANDPLELLAVDGPANQEKGDGDAATWLPPNKPFRCQYVARQIAVKAKYHLWMTQAEHDASAKILGDCPGQELPASRS